MEGPPKQEALWKGEGWEDVETSIFLVASGPKVNLLDRVTSRDWPFYTRLNHSHLRLPLRWPRYTLETALAASPRTLLRCWSFPVALHVTSPELSH